MASSSRFFPDPPGVGDPPRAGDPPDPSQPPADPAPASNGAYTAPDDARSGRSPARAAARQARVAALQRSWALVMAAGVLAIPAIVVHSILVGGAPTFEVAGQGAWGFVGWLGERIGLVLDALSIGRPSGPLDSTLASIVGIVVFAAAFFGVGDVASRLWAGWDERERQLGLQPVPQWRQVRQIEGPLWLCGAAAMLLLLFAGSGDWLLATPSAVLVAAAWLVATRLSRGHVVNP